MNKWIFIQVIENTENDKLLKDCDNSAPRVGNSFFEKFRTDRLAKNLQLNEYQVTLPKLISYT